MENDTDLIPETINELEKHRLPKWLLDDSWFYTSILLAWRCSSDTDAFVYIIEPLLISIIQAQSTVDTVVRKHKLTNYTKITRQLFTQISSAHYDETMNLCLARICDRISYARICKFLKKEDKK